MIHPPHYSAVVMIFPFFRPMPDLTLILASRETALFVQLMGNYLATLGAFNGNVNQEFCQETSSARCLHQENI